MPLIAEWRGTTDTGAAWVARRRYLEHAEIGSRLEATLGSSGELNAKEAGTQTK
jgi:hypothetical protein